MLSLKIKTDFGSSRNNTPSLLVNKCAISEAGLSYLQDEYDRLGVLKHFLLFSVPQRTLLMTLGYFLSFIVIF